MVAEAEAASRERRQQRRTVPVPFSFTHRQTRSEKKAEVQDAGSNLTNPGLVLTSPACDPNMAGVPTE
jgi:hypothetical protein